MPRACDWSPALLPKLETSVPRTGTLTPEPGLAVSGKVRAFFAPLSSRLAMLAGAGSGLVAGGAPAVLLPSS